MRRRYENGDGEWIGWEEPFEIDFLAIRCWGSGIGFRRIAFEVKVSRSDFAAELRKPSKRANALSLSHQFFFAAPKGLIRPDEVPPECGLMEVDSKGRTRTVVKAPLREPRALRMSEVVSLMRRPVYRDGVMELRRQVLALARDAEWRQTAAEELRDERDAAQEALRRLSGHLVTVGSQWTGEWRPWSWVPAQADVPVYVSSVERDIVGVRRLDGDGGEWRLLRGRAQLLAHFTPLDSPAGLV